MPKFPLIACVFACAIAALGGEVRELHIGIANHAFDHLGNIGEQADAAAASGSTIIYATGFGGIGYTGLSSSEEMVRTRKAVRDYNQHAKKNGIQMVIGYVCATSIVKLETFDRNWTKEFRTQFSTSPSQWLQQDRIGEPLPSWYGSNYRPACMNNPDWQSYEKFIVRQQMESGQDGIFFDNPTVHPQGCYCEHCMKKFAEFLKNKQQNVDLPKTNSLILLRELAVKHPKDFMEFRCTIPRDFLAEMRRFARTIKRDALITCNNSLNSPGVVFSQNQDYAYNIYEMSKAEDFVVVEDQSQQPRTLANGSTVEYGYVYKMLHAISHGKPVVAVTIVDGDYQTAPNLVRLAMAEAAANCASYLSWPTWPENQRVRMISTIRPQADFLRNNAALLNDVRPRADVILFLPFRKWTDTRNCWALNAASVLTRSNIQYTVVCEDDLIDRLASNAAKKSILLLESPADLIPREKEAVEKFKKNGRVIFAAKGNWLADIQTTLEQPSIVLNASPNVRATVLDHKNKTVVHLFNLNIQRLSSFDDKVTPASNVRIKVRVPFAKIRSVEMLSADDEASEKLPFTIQKEKKESWVEMTIPELRISAILVIQ